MYRITITEETEVEVTEKQGPWVALEKTKAADGSEKTPMGYAPPRTILEKKTRQILNHEMEDLDLQGIVNALYGKKGG